MFWVPPRCYPPNRKNRQKMPEQIREIPQQTRLAPVGTINAEARTAELVWSTGAAVSRRDWWTGKRYTETLSMDPAHIRMDRMQSGAPLLNTHGQWDLTDILGVVESASVDGGEGRATVKFSDRDDVAGIWRDVQNGIIRNVSVGYMVHKYEITKDEAANTETWRAVDWEPMEISLVPVPADPGAGVRSDNQPQARLVRCAFITHEERQVENDDTQQAPPIPAAPPAPDEAAIRAAAEQATKAERKRCTDIREAVRAGGFGDDMAETMIERGISIDVARSEVLAKLAERSAGGRGPGPRIEAGQQDETETRRAAIADAIFHRVMPSGQLPEPAREYRHMSLLRMAEESLAAQGVRVRGLAPMEIASRAMMSTSDFPSILANVLNKRLRAAYQQSEPTYRRWARRAPNAPDFKQIAVNQLSGAPDLLQVDEHGEFKRGSMSDGKEVYQVATYGRIIAVTRQAVVNDDLRAFDRIPMAFGMAANRLENRLVYAQLTDNPTLSDTGALFNSAAVTTAGGHANLAGSGGAISDTTLSAGRTAMRMQKGLQGEALNIVPAFLIVPATQEQKAYKFTSANYTPATQDNVSEFRAGGRTALEPIVEAELDANSTTAWYLVAAPGLVDTVEYCYLDGSEGVYLETGMEFDIDGIKVKARLDFATKVIDFRGLYKNAGA